MCFHAWRPATLWPFIDPSGEKAPCHPSLVLIAAVSVNWGSFCVIRALLFGVYIRAPEFWNSRIDSSRKNLGGRRVAAGGLASVGVSIDRCCPKYTQIH